MKAQHPGRAGFYSVILLAALAAPARVPAQQAGIKVGTTAPDPVVQTFEGRTIRLSELTRGKPAVLEFWATWCPICRELEPAMAAAQAKHGDHVRFVSVGVRDQQTLKGQEAYVREHNLGGSFVFDRDGEAVKAFQAPHTSFVVAVDSSGTVVYTGVGADQDLEAAIAHARRASRMQRSN